MQCLISCHLNNFSLRGAVLEEQRERERERSMWCYQWSHHNSISCGLDGWQNGMHAPGRLE